MESTIDFKQSEQAIKDAVINAGTAAKPYNSIERVDELRAYFRMFLEPLLRSYKAAGFIADFRIGISPVFFYHPKLRVYFTKDKYFEMPLSKIFPLTPQSKIQIIKA